MVEGQRSWRPGVKRQGNRLPRSRFDQRPVRLKPCADEQGTETSQLFSWHFGSRHAIGEVDAGEPVAQRASMKAGRSVVELLQLACRLGA